MSSKKENKIKRSFSISPETLEILNQMSQRLSEETGMKVSMNTCVEFSILHCSEMTLKELHD